MKPVASSPVAATAQRPQPSVSVITPAYNAEAYLAETINSVVAQTFTDWEMIVVDDGSTDATAAVANEFARKDSRIRVYRQTNTGISGARNAAMSRASGAIFALLDSDDVWRPHYLEEQVRILETMSGNAVVSANAINLGGPFDGSPLKPTPPGVHALSLRTLIETEDSVCIMSVFPRELFERIGGFDTTLRSSEDYDYWLRAAIAGFEIRFNSTPLGYYRRRAESMSADESAMLASISTVLRKTRDALPDGAAEAAAIDRQLARFQYEAVANNAKAALQNGDFRAAADQFASLAAYRGSTEAKLIGLAARRIPRVLQWAHRARRMMQRARRRIPVA